MTGESQKEYIITGSELDRLEKNGLNPDIGVFVKEIRSRPYKSSDKVLDELLELVKEDLKEDFDGELYITHGDFLFDVSQVRQKEREQG